MLDHPVTQKFLLAVASTTVIGIGGVAYKSNLTLERHDVLINASQQNDMLMQETIISELKDIRRDVGDIKTSVAVIKERTTALEKDVEKNANARARP